MTTCTNFFISKWRALDILPIIVEIDVLSRINNCDGVNDSITSNIATDDAEQWLGEVETPVPSARDDHESEESEVSKTQLETTSTGCVLYQCHILFFRSST